jgi:hypothetical protein
MATPVVVDPGVVETNIDAAAEQRFEAALQRLSGEQPPAAPLEPAPAAVAPVQPETPVVAAPVPPDPAAPVAAPSEATPPAVAASPAAPASVITLDLNSLTPELRASWENAIAKAGGDPTKVASLMWDYNNRLAALSTPPGAVAPAAQPAAPPPPAPPAQPVQTVEEQVDARLAEVLPGDPRVAELRSEHLATIEKIKVITEPLGVKFENPKQALQAVNESLSRLEKNIDRFTFRLGESDIDEDKRAEYQSKLSQSERAQAQLERLRDKVESLDTKFQTRRGALRESIADRFYEQHEAIKAREDAAKELATYQAKFGQVWPSYMTNAAKAAGIDPELTAGFDQFARAHALLESNAGRLDLTEQAVSVELPTFLANAAKAYLKQVDDHARIKATISARRAATPQQPVIIPDGTTRVPVLGQNGAPAPGQSVPQRSADIDEQADARVTALLQNMGA